MINATIEVRMTSSRLRGKPLMKANYVINSNLKTLQDVHSSKIF